ncbi:MAG: hypothetical protein HY646_14135, partial [Acidobacteria bacterium]|nr:hypothetical protein [Acidobacteriota bacterium]
MLTALAICALASAASAAEIQIRRVSNDLLEVSGGKGNETWRIQYGSERSIQALGLAGPDEIAYFTHGNWLRRVNVVKGMVTGRWRMPGDTIAGLKWRDKQIEVDVEQRAAFLNQRLRRTILFDPEAPDVPSWQLPLGLSDRASS